MSPLDPNRMTVIILHRIPHHKVRYHEIIDHDLHDVYYVVTNKGEDIPSDIRHNKIHVSSSNYIEATIGEIMNIDIHPDKVIALSEYNLIAAEIIRTVFSINYIDSNQKIKSIYSSRDKRLMKLCVNNEKLPTARSFSISSFDDLTNNCLDFSKFVVKPTSGAASENTKTFSKYDQLLQDEELISSLNNNDTYIVEEFIQGEIYHFDGFVVDSDIQFVIGSKYIGNCLDFVSGLPLGSIQVHTIDQHMDWIVKCVSAVGIKNGAFHLEGILSDRGMIFLEIGNRSGGAGVVECTEKALGINLMQEEVRLSFMGDKYSPPKLMKNKELYGWFVIPSSDYYNSTLNFETLKTNFPEIIDLKINSNPNYISSISYSEDHNPCTGIIMSQSHVNGINVIDNIFSMMGEKK